MNNSIKKIAFVRHYFEIYNMRFPISNCKRVLFQVEFKILFRGTRALKIFDVLKASNNTKPIIN